MARLLFNIAAAISLVLLVTSSVFGVRSYWRWDYLEHTYLLERSRIFQQNEARSEEGLVLVSSWSARAHMDEVSEVRRVQASKLGSWRIGSSEPPSKIDSRELMPSFERVLVDRARHVGLSRVVAPSLAAQAYSVATREMCRLRLRPPCQPGSLSRVRARVRCECAKARTGSLVAPPPHRIIQGVRGHTCDGVVHPKDICEGTFTARQDQPR